MKLVIPGRLMGLNEYIRLCRSNKFSAAAQKTHIENMIILHIRNQFKNKKISGKVHLNFGWYEKNKKRDLDNIAFAHKFILDALVKSRTIENDGWANIAGFTDSFYIDKENPRVEVEILSGGKYVSTSQE